MRGQQTITWLSSFAKYMWQIVNKAIPQNTEEFSFSFIVSIPDHARSLWSQNKRAKQVCLPYW